MTRNKPAPKKRRLIARTKSAVPAPVFALLKKMGKRKSSRWRLNPKVKSRNWRRTRTKC